MVDRLLRHGILSKDTHGTVIRIAPPLNVPREALSWAVVEIRRVFADLDQAAGRLAWRSGMGRLAAARRVRARRARVVGADRRILLAMADAPADKLVVAISSRALFDFEEENRSSRRPTIAPTCSCSCERLERPAKPGVAFSLVRKLLAFNADGARASRW